jgi:transcriptional regulator with XRE-family HTH domain
MTGGAFTNVASKSTRTERLAKQLRNKGFRHGYFVRQLKAFLATQIRSLRGGLSQTEFGKLIDKPQSVVSRLEKQSYGKVSLQTLIDIAVKLDIALIVRFVNYASFVKLTEDFSESSVRPDPYADEQMDELESCGRRGIVRKRMWQVGIGDYAVTNGADSMDVCVPMGAFEVAQ